MLFKSIFACMSKEGADLSDRGAKAYISVFEVYLYLFELRRDSID